MHFEFLKLPDAVHDVPELKEAFARLRKYFKENVTDVVPYPKGFVAAFEFTEDAKAKTEDLQRILAMWISRLIMDPNTKLPGLIYEGDDSLPGARYSAIMIKDNEVFLYVFPKMAPVSSGNVSTVHVDFAGLRACVVE